jgi:hypothetical protein
MSKLSILSTVWLLTNKLAYPQRNGLNGRVNQGVIFTIGSIWADNALLVFLQFCTVLPIQSQSDSFFEQTKQPDKQAASSIRPLT